MHRALRRLALLSPFAALIFGACSPFLAPRPAGAAAFDDSKARARLAEADNLVAQDPAKAALTYLDARLAIVEARFAPEDAGREHPASSEERCSRALDALERDPRSTSPEDEALRDVLWRSYLGRAKALRALHRESEVLAEIPAARCPTALTAECGEHVKWIFQTFPSSVMKLAATDNAVLSAFDVDNKGQPGSPQAALEREQSLDEHLKKPAGAGFAITLHVEATPGDGGSVIAVDRGRDVDEAVSNCASTDRYELNHQNGHIEQQIQCGADKRIHVHATSIEVHVDPARASAIAHGGTLTFVVPSDSVKWTTRQGRRVVTMSGALSTARSPSCAGAFSQGVDLSSIARSGQ